MDRHYGEFALQQNYRLTAAAPSLHDSRTFVSNLHPAPPCVFSKDERARWPNSQLPSSAGQNFVEGRELASLFCGGLLLSRGRAFIFSLPRLSWRRGET
jgi:hypothetical protein